MHDGTQKNLATRISKPGTVAANNPRQRAVRRPAARSAECSAAALAIPDVLADVPPAELRETVARLTVERDRLRHDLAKARGRVAALERLADEDALTPVANRRAFVRQLTRMIAFAQRYGVPASIVYFDVNNMKQINDAYGHPAGDEALRHIATVLRDNVRSSDTVGRLGGDEFGVILAQTDEPQAHNKAAALAAAIEAMPLRWAGVKIKVSAAYGVHTFSGAETPQHAIEAADRAMYEQKRAMPHPAI